MSCREAHCKVLQCQDCCFIERVRLVKGAQATQAAWEREEATLLPLPHMICEVMRRQSFHGQRQMLFLLPASYAFELGEPPLVDICSIHEALEGRHCITPVERLRQALAQLCGLHFMAPLSPLQETGNDRMSVKVEEASCVNHGVPSSSTNADASQIFKQFSDQAWALGEAHINLHLRSQAHACADRSEALICMLLLDGLVASLNLSLRQVCKPHFSPVGAKEASPRTHSFCLEVGGIGT